MAHSNENKFYEKQAQSLMATIFDSSNQLSIKFAKVGCWKQYLD